MMTDNSSKCDAALGVAQFRRNFPQFRAGPIMEDGGAIICRRRPGADRRAAGRAAAIQRDRG